MAVLGRSVPGHRGVAHSLQEKPGLPFTLLADPEHEAPEAYGVWTERTRRGRKSMGVHRSTFVIGPDGTIVKAMRGVRPEGHPQEALEALPA